MNAPVRVCVSVPISASAPSRIQSRSRYRSRRRSPITKRRPELGLRRPCSGAPRVGPAIRCRAGFPPPNCDPSSLRKKPNDFAAPGHPLEHAANHAHRGGGDTPPPKPPPPPPPPPLAIEATHIKTGRRFREIEASRRPTADLGRGGSASCSWADCEDCAVSRLPSASILRPREKLIDDYPLSAPSRAPLADGRRRA